MTCSLTRKCSYIILHLVDETAHVFQDILAYNNDDTVSKFPFPIIADEKRELAVDLGMLDPNEKDQTGMPLTARCVSTTGLYPF